MGLTEGIERTDEFRVEGDLLTDVDGTLPLAVLSTPGMISMMEWAATRWWPTSCPTTTRPWASRSASSTWAGRWRARCAPSRRDLREFVEVRKLRFDVEVKEGERTIGVGTHERRVIPVAR